MMDREDNTVPEAAAKSHALTLSVADFVVATDAAMLPEAVVSLGKKSILDGIGLALSGVGRAGPS